MHRLPLLLGLLALAPAFTGVLGADRYVDCAALENGDGSKDDPWNSIRAAAAEDGAEQDDVVWVEKGPCSVSNLTLGDRLSGTGEGTECISSVLWDPADSMG